MENILRGISPDDAELAGSIDYVRQDRDWVDGSSCQHGFAPRSGGAPEIAG